ncbi:THO complex subunit 6 homolog [Biomphalaria glabrata]|uniref:THO complex subunit 6 homolog n=1 Tax=Biomphalaria glabrata TaxID=6526 RepID=A0A9U8EKP5_BIOGL|nr:THO complex subunit 6 homolog [Biomphalaria glabrata]
MHLKESRQACLYMLHNVVYDTKFSPCGKYLAAANKFGDIALFSLTAALSPDASDESKCPIFSFHVYDQGGIYSLCSTDIFLICAGEGDIQAYKWSDIIAKNPKVAWSLSIPKKGVFSHAEINSCVIHQDSSSMVLYAGAGDHLVHSWDIENGSYLNSFSGHTDYIHSIVTKDDGKNLISASEDGTAVIWDVRLKEAAQVVKPFENEKCARPHIGKWLKCLTVDEDNYWLLLGGGPTLATWHLKTLTPTATYETPGVAQHVALFHEDKILSAGSSNHLNHWSIAGEHKMAVPVNPSSIFSIDINHNSKSNKVLTVAGSSDKIDVCSNFGYTAFSLTFVPPLS